jgi:hypothetical protein
LFPRVAETTTAPNNRAIVYSGKPQRERPRENEFMPVVSKAQNAAMHSAAEGKSTLGIPKSVGQEFTADQAPGSVKKLPARVHKMAKRGMISAKANKKHLGKYGGNDQEGIDASSR